MKPRLALVVVAGALGVLAFVSWVWPTKWRYEVASIHSAREARLLIRVSRFTGEAHYLTRDGWEVASPDGIARYEVAQEAPQQ